MTKEDREEIQKMIDEAISKFNFIKSYDPSEVKPFFPVKPYNPDFLPPSVSSTTCSKCRMVWAGAMGYCCPSFDCPMQTKAAY